MALTHPEAALIAVGQKYSEIVRRCERLRISERYPHAAWSAAWTERQRLLSEMLRAAEALSPQPPADGADAGGGDA